MLRFLLLALLLLTVVPAFADHRSGGRLDAITQGRLYDRILTPRMNPSFSLDARAERDLLRDLRNGRLDTSRIPEGRLRYFEYRLENSR
ncbi:hypothetical protein [Oricola cellulosilytica]|uniref:Uncharacterized protein n=1 Tax=Oricola cellulosilytica TaxID=1429082 RepID=A0A4R0PG70_9HYPH|nr:hypothetical protein [Oricola cellulosilytica]TCD15923.1 hypothetical protein E0D97_00330 [Oricola cellulosilytica]